MSLSNKPNKTLHQASFALRPGVTKVPYSTKKISTHLLNELTDALKSIDSYGSVEIYVQDSTVTQITTRNIKKTQNLMRNIANP